MSFINASIRIHSQKVWRDSNLEFSPQEELSFGKFAKSIYKHLELKYMKFYKMDEISKLGLLGTELLLKDIELLQDYKAEEIGIILANSSASIFTDRKYFETIRNADNYFPSPSLFVYTLPNIVMGEIAIKQGFKGENTFFIQKHFNAKSLILQTELLLKRKSQKALICGWIEVGENGYDCFLYIVENTDRGKHLEHNIDQINSLKKQTNQ